MERSLQVKSHRDWSLWALFKDLTKLSMPARMALRSNLTWKRIDLTTPTYRRYYSHLQRWARRRPTQARATRMRPSRTASATCSCRTVLTLCPQITSMTQMEASQRSAQTTPSDRMCTRHWASRLSRRPCRRSTWRTRSTTRGTTRVRTHSVASLRRHWAAPSDHKTRSASWLIRRSPSPRRHRQLRSRSVKPEERI